MSDRVSALRIDIDDLVRRIKQSVREARNKEKVGIRGSISFFLA